MSAKMRMPSAAMTTPETSDSSCHGARPSSAGDVLPIAAIAAGGCAVWLWFALATRISLEDAYITFRYAGNIAQGDGFVYNLGERVLGTTTPLQAFLLAGLGRILGAHKIPLVVTVLMPLFGAAAGVVAYSALVRLGIPRAGAAAGALLFYLHPLVIKTSLGGMETPLVIFLMALSLHFLSRNQSIAATTAVAFLALCRIDGLIWGALIIGVALLSRHRRPLRQAAAFAAVIAPWLIFSALYFGSLVPNTMLAKGVVRPGREDLLFQPLHFSRLSSFYVSGAGLAIGDPLFSLWLFLLGLGVYAVARAKRRELLLLPLFPPVYAVLMYLGRAPKYEWYLAPMLFPSLFLGGAGVGRIISWVGARKADWRLRAAAAICIGVLMALAITNGAPNLPKRVRHTKLFQENEFGLRRAVGLWLRDNTPTDASVAMEAIGYQGYYSNRRIIDMAGLVTPRVIEFKASTGSNAVLFNRIVTELRPDYIVLRSFEVDENRHFNGGKLFETDAHRGAFFDRYREAARFVAPHPELAPLITHLTVYQRNRPESPSRHLPPTPEPERRVSAHSPAKR